MPTIDAPARAGFTQQEAEQFLYREARALDDRDWDAWLALYAPDVEFWMPAWDDDDKLTEDPQNEISLIWYGHKGGLEDRAYRIALLQSKLMTQEQGIDGVMDKQKLDAIVAPSGGVAWMTDLVSGDCGVFESSSLAAVAGYPNITVPAGYIQGLPAGISFFGRAFSEGVLIKAAYAFEQATLARLLDRLPDGQRRVVELRLAGLSGEDVAYALGRSRTAVKMLQLRAVRTLRAALAELDRLDREEGRDGR